MLCPILSGAPRRCIVYRDLRPIKVLPEAANIKHRIAGSNIISKDKLHLLEVGNTIGTAVLRRHLQRIARCVVRCRCSRLAAVSTV